MSINTDLQKIRNIQSQRHNLSMHLSHCLQPTDTKDNIKRSLDRTVELESKLSMEFMRTYTVEIGRMLDREQRFRRIIKEFSPHEK